MELDKELGCKWNFLTRRAGSLGQGSEDASFKPFINHKLRCLVREYIQNSMDAYSKRLKDPVVEVHFETGSLICAEYPELIGSLHARLIACSEHCKLYPNSKNPYQSKVEYLEEHLNSSIGFLKVSDYNTRGMSYIDDDDQTSPFRACVRESSASYKTEENAGGSHGLGKTVGFINSGINAIYYSSMDEDGHAFGEGVIKVCDHKLTDANGVTQKYESAAFYDSHNGEKPNKDEEIPEAFRRNKPGTDAYVLGIEVTAEDIQEMKAEVIRSFFKAFFDNKLAVVIDGERIDNTNLSEKILLYFNDSEYGAYDTIRTNEPCVYFNPRPYFLEVLMNYGKDEDHISLNTEEDFPEKFPDLGNATLYIWKSDDIKAIGYQDTVVCMRDNSMVIDVRRTRKNKGYYGVCICDGSGSKYLRMMENATHDKWDLAEVKEASKENKKKAKATLAALAAFIKACEEKVFPEIIDHEEEIQSLKKHRIGLADRSNLDNNDSAAWPTTNISSEIKDNKTGDSSATIIDTRVGGKKKKKKKGTQTKPLPPAGPGGEENPGFPPPDHPREIPENPSEKEPNIPGVEGEGTDTGSTYEDKPSGTHMREIKIDGRCRRLIPLHDGEFACKIVITVPEDYEKCKMALSVQAVSGKIPLAIKRVSDGCKITGDDYNEISGFDLRKGEPNVIKFTPVESIKHYSLIIEAYGH